MVCGCLLLLAFIEYRSKLVLHYIWAGPPAAYAALPADRKSVVLNLPLLAPDVALEPIYMYFSTFGWNSLLINGYSGFSPPSYGRLLDVMKDFPTDEAVEELRARRVDFIIVHAVFFRPEVYDRLIAELDARRELRLVGTYRWQLRETRVYQLAPAAP